MMLKWVFVGGFLLLMVATYLSLWLHSKWYYYAMLALWTALMISGMIFVFRTEDPPDNYTAAFGLILGYAVLLYIYNHKYFMRHEAMRLVDAQEFKDFLAKRPNPSLAEKATLWLTYLLGVGVIILIAVALFFPT